MSIAGEIVVLDFETTGLSPSSGARITEVAALRLTSAGVVDAFVSLVNCGVRVPANIVALTGISDAMLRNAPSAREVLSDLLQFLGSTSLCAHNASFDMRFLQNECALQRFGPRFGASICTMKLSRKVFPGLPNYRLSTVSSELRIRRSGSAHRAESDARLTTSLLLRAAQRVCEEYQINSVDGSTLATISHSAGTCMPSRTRVMPHMSQRHNDVGRCQAPGRVTARQAQDSRPATVQTYGPTGPQPLGNRPSESVRPFKTVREGSSPARVTSTAVAQERPFRSDECSAQASRRWALSKSTGVLTHRIDGRKYLDGQFSYVSGAIAGFAIGNRYGPDVFIKLGDVQYVD